MEMNPTTQEVDDFIRRQEEVERLRSSTAESLVQFYSKKRGILEWSEKTEESLQHAWEESLRHAWNALNELEREIWEE